ncbi:hypothetical protein, partial [Corynebacterium striatum]
IEYANDAFEENPNAPHVDVEVEAVNRGILARKVKKYSDDLVIIDGPPSNHSMSELKRPGFSSASFTALC